MRLGWQTTGGADEEAPGDESNTPLTVPASV